MDDRTKSMMLHRAARMFFPDTADLIVEMIDTATILSYAEAKDLVSREKIRQKLHNQIDRRFDECDKLVRDGVVPDPLKVSR